MLARPMSPAYAPHHLPSPRDDTAGPLRRGPLFTREPWTASAESPPALQMMGRAGRPQFDTVGIAVVMVHAPKKAFYKRFLYEPFPVESSLSDALHNHLNAEVF